MHSLDLYLNADRPEGQACLLRGATTMDTLAAWPILLGDRVLCRLWFLRAATAIGGTPKSVDVLDDGELIQFGGKLGSALDSQNFVIGATGWEKVSAEDIVHFEQVVTFDSPALRAGFTSSSQTSVTLTGAVRLLGAGADAEQDKLTYQFPITCVRGVILGTEGIDENANPQYPLPEQLVTTDGMAAALAGYAAIGDLRIPDRDNGNALKRLVIKDGQIKFESIE